MERIGIFALGIVLMPESSLHLHIFEERYKQLINNCWDNQDYFGINYISGPKFNDIGCSAEVSNIINKYEDGKMDIMVTGTNRFKIINFVVTEKLYSVAEVEFIEDIKEEIDLSLLTDCIVLFNKIADIVKTVKIDQLTLETIDAKTPSFIIAQKAGLTLEQRQYLLDTLSENQRLAFLQKHLTKITPMLTETENLNLIIKNDGYVKPNFRRPKKL
jgi:Lon protease-like protein